MCVVSVLLLSFRFVRGGFAHVIELSPFSSRVLYFCFYACMVCFRFDVRIWYASSPCLLCCAFAFLKLISILFIYLIFIFIFLFFGVFCFVACRIWILLFSLSNPKPKR